MDWRPRITTACIWSVPLLAVDIGYIVQHGFDAAAVGFTALTVLPAWAFLGRNVDIKLPGGGGVTISGDELHDAARSAEVSGPEAVKQAEEKLPEIRQVAEERKAALSITGNAAIVQPNQLVSAEGLVTDPNLALVGLRIDIERRLAKLANMFAIPPRNLLSIIGQLQQLNVLSDDFAKVLRRFVEFGNQAAHGAVVDPQAASAILEGRQAVLDTLDAIIREVDPQERQ